jgi:hypothetical protein
MFLELSRNLHALEAGTETYKMRLYVGHDGSMIRLASGLGIGNQAPLKWPALGSEITMEVRTARVAPFRSIVVSCRIDVKDAGDGLVLPYSCF